VFKKIIMSKQTKIEQFDPNGVGLKNGNFIGLPFDESESSIVLMPVPWDVTVSYNDGTATAADNILEASSQLDLHDSDVPDAWKYGIFYRPMDENWLKKSQKWRKKAKKYIEFLENGGVLSENSAMQQKLNEINIECEALKNWVYTQTKDLLNQNKLVGLIGGEHSIPLGYLEALSERYENFGILQIDAHFDLRDAYEGFLYSHASIFYNSLKIKNLQRITHVGIRDYCAAEADLVRQSAGRNVVFYDQDLREMQFEGQTWRQICREIVGTLPQNVYISFDIDGLEPNLCPHTGTPVAGGLMFWEAVYLLKMVVSSGRKIIGFDLSEVGGVGNEWDGNVGARILYKLANLMGQSNHLKF
jgi:agmatinase